VETSDDVIKKGLISDRDNLASFIFSSQFRINFLGPPERRVGEPVAACFFFCSPDTALA
jgi:hypothetical protein